MNYLKTAAEVIDYLTRDVEATVGRELALSRIASRLVDSYCGRTLSIQYYLLDFELNRAGVGYIPRRPIVALAPTSLTTGLQVRPITVNMGGSRSFTDTLSDYPDSTDVLAPLYNNISGRIELSPSGLSSSTDFGRGGAGGAAYYQARVEVYAGFLVDTTLALPAAHGTSTLKLDSVIGVEANKTRVNLGASTAVYLITSVDVDNNLVTVNPPIPQTYNSGTEVTQVVPEEVKLATASIISDQLTYEPNTLRQTSTLDVLTDRLSRMNNHPIPVEAQHLLAHYRN